MGAVAVLKVMADIYKHGPENYSDRDALHPLPNRFGGGGGEWRHLELLPPIMEPSRQTPTAMPESSCVSQTDYHQVSSLPELPRSGKSLRRFRKDPKGSEEQQFVDR